VLVIDVPYVFLGMSTTRFAGDQATDKSTCGSVQRTPRAGHPPIADPQTRSRYDDEKASRLDDHSISPCPPSSR